MSGEMILFAEDEAQQLKYMRRLLEREGYRVLGAQDGLEAVTLHRRHSNDIELVVLDLRLPKLSGWDALQEMKKEDPQLKALIASAYVTPEVKSAIESGELLGLFVKPYSVDLFLARISDVVRKPACPTREDYSLNRLRF
jgi:two-component system, cell cycle sensor histidine kinase and response regulator CckA